MDAGSTGDTKTVPRSIYEKIGDLYKEIKDYYKSYTYSNIQDKLIEWFLFYGLKNKMLCDVALTRVLQELRTS